MNWYPEQNMLNICIVSQLGLSSSLISHFIIIGTNFSDLDEGAGEIGNVLESFVIQFKPSSGFT